MFKVWGGFGGLVFLQYARNLWDKSLERDYKGVGAFFP